MTAQFYESHARSECGENRDQGGEDDTTLAITRITSLAVLDAATAEPPPARPTDADAKTGEVSTRIPAVAGQA